MTEVWAGPMGTSLLGDLGADVVKVESFPRLPSFTRPLIEAGTFPGDGPPYERAGLHHLVNRNKRNISLNIRSEKGAEAMRRLAEWGDILVDGYTAGMLEGLGFGWDVLREINPRLIVISIPGWGVEGPYRGYATLGSGLDSTVGHASVRGYPESPPLETTPVFHTDATAAVGLVPAVVGSLLRREETGRGLLVDLSQAESFAWQLPGLYAEWTMNGRLPERLGNNDPHIVPHNAYKAAGGSAGDESWVVIAAENDAQWAGVATAAGHPEWSELGHPWATVVGRMRARAEIDAALQAFVADGIAEDVADAIAAHGGIAAPVSHPVGVLTSPQVLARDWLITSEHRYVAGATLAGFVWRVAPDAPSIDRQTALAGEHNADVLAELGFTEDEVAEMMTEGVIGDSYLP